MFGTVVQAGILGAMAACLGGPLLVVFVLTSKPENNGREELGKVRRS